MGLAAYPGGLDELRTDDNWLDILATSFYRLHKRRAAPEELESPPGAVQELAVEIALRELHAARAATLGMISWNSSTGQTYHLIEDQALRDTFGPMIGRIAHSHWWDVEQLPIEFGTLVGGSVDLPPSWNVNQLLLACMLRLADIAHLDARRAPGFLMALRRPQGVALQHWNFQTFLQRMYRSDDRLCFTAVHAFIPAEATSWWLCLAASTLCERWIASFVRSMRC